MLLVLAVIGTLAALTWPSVLRMQADHDLSAAAVSFQRATEASFAERDLDPLELPMYEELKAQFGERSSARR